MDGRVVLDGEDLTRRPAHRDRARRDRVRAGRAAPVPGDDREEQSRSRRVSAGARTAATLELVLRPLPAAAGATAPARRDPERRRAADAGGGSRADGAAAAADARRADDGSRAEDRRRWRSRRSRDSRTTGMTLLIAEQQVPLALSVADRGYVLENGRIRLHGTSEELERNPEVQTRVPGCRMRAVILDGIVLGLAFGLLGVGMTLVYGLGGVLNLAYGQIVVLAAIVISLSWTTASRRSRGRSWASLAAAGVAVAARPHADAAGLPPARRGADAAGPPADARRRVRHRGSAHLALSGRRAVHLHQRGPDLDHRRADGGREHLGLGDRARGRRGAPRSSSARRPSGAASAR